jgi:hypothetical protein
MLKAERELELALELDDAILSSPLDKAKGWSWKLFVVFYSQ